jgi:hypothetical protein
MNHQQALEEFISRGGSWEQGIEIYQALGTDNYLKNYLFPKGENEYSFNRLREELTKIHSSLSEVLSAPKLNTAVNKPVKKKATAAGLSVDDFFNLPEELQRRRLEIGQLYSEVITCRKAIRRVLNLPSKGTITLQECFHIMSQLDRRGNPIPFAITWITFDTKSNTGGEVKQLDCFLKFGNKTGSKYKPVAEAVSDRRDPRHFIHGTINLQVCNTLEVRKANTWLIMNINCYDVILNQNG